MKALLVVDIQNDFLPGGSLAVKDGDEIIPLVNRLMNEFDLVVATQDWHPSDHGSFASNNEGKKPGDIIVLNGLDQILWPDHCVQNSEGAAFNEELNTEQFARVFRKGTDVGIDSYSGFFDNGKKKDTGLNAYLKSQSVDRVYISGLATDYCVKYTAIDAVECGYATWVIQDATRAVNLEEGDFEKAIEEMKAKGVEIMHSRDIK